MNNIIKFLFLTFVFSGIALGNLSLINKDYVANFLTKEACWADSHCAQNDFLGTGMLYYCLAYMKKGKILCLPWLWWWICTKSN